MVIPIVTHTHDRNARTEVSPFFLRRGLLRCGGARVCASVRDGSHLMLQTVHTKRTRAPSPAHCSPREKNGEGSVRVFWCVTARHAKKTVKDAASVFWCVAQFVFVGALLSSCLVVCCSVRVFGCVTQFVFLGVLPAIPTSYASRSIARFSSVDLSQS